MAAVSGSFERSRGTVGDNFRYFYQCQANSENNHADTAQIRGLKLAKEGDLFPREANKWTHRDASITDARATDLGSGRKRSSL
ncbi:UNVERIFIED_ORG: hypothetical protein BTE55_06865 [Rhizobium sophorae]